jgi:uncharacterized membrane protein
VLFARLVSAVNAYMSTRAEIKDTVRSPKGEFLVAGSRLASLIWICTILAIAVTLRLLALGAKSFWLDEAASTMLARVDWPTFLSALIHRQANMAFYYLLLRPWIYLGESEAWVRLLSVVFGVAASLVIYQVGRLALNEKSARIAALLLAVNAFHVEYSQEARGYSLAVFSALLSSYFFLKSASSEKRNLRFAYVTTSVLTIYAQILGIWLLLSQSLCVMGIGDLRKTHKKMLGAAVLIAALAAPLAYVLILKSDRSQLAWMNQNSASGLYRFLLDFAGNAGTPLMILEMALLAVSVFFHLRKDGSPTTTRNVGYIFLLVWSLLPVTVMAGLSLRWPMLQARYLILCLPPFLLLVADGLTHIRSRILFVAALTAVAGLSVVGVSSYLHSRADLTHVDDWRNATRYVLAQATPGDAVLFPYSAEEIPFREYQGRFTDSGKGIVLVPTRTDWQLLSTPGSWTSQELAAQTASLHSRVWTISALQPNSQSLGAQRAIASHLNRQSTRTFGFVTVRLFSNRSMAR